MGTDRPAFLITIDTEGDDLWSAPREITTRNAAFLSRFQTLCERHGLKPTWLTNYEMATSPRFQGFMQDALRRGTAELGMHLHAWNSPPIVPLTEDDFRYQPYLIEYPLAVMSEKTKTLTGLLEDTFGVKMVSHRAGRWSVNAAYLKLLADQGYLVDCSVTPHVSWRHVKGDPAQSGGTDFSAFPDRPYFVDLNQPGRAGNSDLLELPVTIVPSARNLLRAIGGVFPRLSMPGRAWNRFFPPVSWLRPNGRNLRQMQGILAHVLRERRPYAEFMLHSSELMPGGSPTFRSSEAIEALYRQLEQLFAVAGERFVGMTLQEYDRAFRAGSRTGLDSVGPATPDLA
jgi:hypothetical protein